MLRVDTVPIRDDILLQYTGEDGRVATRSIEDEILAGGKLVPQPLAGQGGTIPAAVTEKHTHLNPERPMVNGRHVAGEAVSAQVFGSVMVSPACCVPLHTGSSFAQADARVGSPALEQAI